MTTFNPNYGAYLPPNWYLNPPPPPPPPSGTTQTVYETQPDGSIKAVEVVVITASRPPDPYANLQQYRGITGAQENSTRNMQFAMASPEERALMLGVNPYASTEVARDENLPTESIEILNVSNDVDVDAKWDNAPEFTLQDIQVPPVPPSFFFARPPSGPLPRHLWQPGEVPTTIPGVSRGLPPRNMNPPVEGPLTRAPASRPSEARRGGESLYDSKGGEWRWYPGDNYHRPHWDYKPQPGPGVDWLNVLPANTSFVVTT